MSQSLFSLQLAAEAADRLLPRDPARRGRAAGHRADPGGPGRRRSCAPRSRASAPPTSSATAWRRSLGAQLTLAGRAHGVDVELRVDDPPDLDPEAEHQVLRVAQEAVTNALRHAGASCVQVTLDRARRRRPGAVVLRVATTGAGFDPEARPSGPAASGSPRCTSGPASLGGTPDVDLGAGRGHNGRAAGPGVSEATS